jgi:hypothetical protein
MSLSNLTLTQVENVITLAKETPLVRFFPPVYGSSGGLSSRSGLRIRKRSVTSLLGKLVQAY